MRILANTLLLLYVLVIPIGLCILWEYYPALFRRGRLFLWIPGISIFSWVCVLGAILIPYYCGFFVPRGPELCFALFFGWLYLWIAGIPVFVIYGLLCLVRYLKKIIFSQKHP
mgnify:CR=1 FL=1